MLSLMVLSIMMKSSLFQIPYPIQDKNAKTLPYYFTTKMVKIDTLVVTKTTENRTPCRTYTVPINVREYPTPVGGSGFGGGGGDL